MQSPQPHSARYWRFNAIAALRSLDLNESTAVDPEHLAQIRADKNLLDTLLLMERRIKARYNRMRKEKL